MKRRGADAVVQTLAGFGCERLFTLSGNQIMSVFDAAIDSDIKLLHVRHEAAAVHMADAWGRLTGRPGVGLVTAGPGFANCLSALYVARMAESPLVLLSGAAPVARRGEAPFQEMAQAEMAGHVVKASWMVERAEDLAADVSRAMALAASGRPGPVHLELPVDLLEAPVERSKQSATSVEFSPPPADQVQAIVELLASAVRPLILTGPAVARQCVLLEQLADTTKVPVVPMESPRGVNDPALGAISEVLPAADVVLLLGKKLDFTLRAAGDIVFGTGTQLLQLDADESVLELTKRVVGGDACLAHSVVCDPIEAVKGLLSLDTNRGSRDGSWCDDVHAATTFRPAEWREVSSVDDQGLHPAYVCREIDRFLADEHDSVFISDGGEFGQWAQACIRARTRLINGPSGSIGSVIPFAIAARLACPDARIVATCGDGTFGFHAMEFDTALRYQLPFISVVGNDAMWNAEYQIQLRKYGEARALHCDLTPTRYDEVVASLGGSGHNITCGDEMATSLAAAGTSRLPACLNVRTAPIAAPVIRRTRI